MEGTYFKHKSLIKYLNLYFFFAFPPLVFADFFFDTPLGFTELLVVSFSAALRFDFDRIVRFEEAAAEIILAKSLALLRTGDSILLLLRGVTLSGKGDG